MKNEKQAYWIDDFTEAYGPSRATIYREINSGRLKAFKVGRRTAISRRAAENWVLLCEKEFKGFDDFGPPPPESDSPLPWSGSDELPF